MSTPHFIPIETLCTHYEIEVSFFSSLSETGLIRLEILGQTRCLHEEHIPGLERMIRLHRELNLNTEGIDVVMNLLGKMDDLKEELEVTKSRLRLYEE
jgi:chaperone modulatory protein CbpM